MAEKKEEVKVAYSLKEVPTQTGMVVVDKDGKEFGQMDILVEILNKLDKIEKEIA